MKEKGQESPSWHPVLVLAIAQCLQDIFVDGYYADKVLERIFKNNKKWGSRDRRFLAETVYDMVRWWELLAQVDGLGFVPAARDHFLIRWAFYEAKQHQVDATVSLKER